VTLRAVLLVVGGCFLLRPTVAVGQGSIKNRLTLSGTTVAFPTVVEADYNVGWVAATNSITATFDASKAGGPANGVQRTAIISLSSTAATMGATKPIADLQWRRSDLSTWNSFTTSPVTVDSKQFVFNGLNDPWTATVFFRSLLSWATDAPGTYPATIVFTLTITTP
jgi:hypothetical protein